MVDLDGSGRTPIVRQSTGVEGKIDWSPDGSRILFRDRNFRLLTIGPDEAGSAAHAWKFCSRSFSPDGTSSSCSATGVRDEQLSTDDEHRRHRPETDPEHQGRALGELG